MQKLKQLTNFLLITGCLLISGALSAATVIDQIGADDSVYDLYNLDPMGIGPSNIIYSHTYDLSGLSSITAATFEIELVGPGGIGFSPLEIYIDDMLLGSSDDRTGAELLFTFDLLALGLNPLIDGDNTIRLEAFTENVVEIDFSRITIEGASVVPVPAAIWLFVTGLVGLLGIAKHKKA